ncbi:MAG: ATP-binding cassette domain-containing protein [Boseongicola sp. SB0662_bin_57]|nr:ATP-binding cassette domain-containing protein [Boseongicola sp. SB0662_bin_57]
MARAPLLQLTGIALTFGGNPLFEDLSLIIQPGDRLALVGRNGSGKSTLLKVMAGLADVDGGERALSFGDSVGYMEQEPDLRGCETLGDLATRGVEASEHWRVDAAADGLKFDVDTPVETASGGARRKAGLARLIAMAPELLLLDEPTNHLDIESIAWLEAHLTEAGRAFVVISHDRAFLRALTHATIWIDRGVVRRREGGFAGFEEWRDRVWAAEDAARHKLDRKILSESKWAVEGISARRRRDLGRVRALEAMRADRANQVLRQEAARMELTSGPRSGKRIIEARGISKEFDGNVICRDFSLRVMRGDRVALVGPNGVGKTAMIELLSGRAVPDEGRIELGTNVELAVFDQHRAELDPDATLWESLTGDKAMRLPGRSDQVMVRGRPRHVVTYLKDFLFDEAQARAPVRSLSGGERARLLLAHIMAKPANLLVLDEPTNDLDMETLDLFRKLLIGSDATILLVSHDRDFVERVATRTLAFEGMGRITVHAGGWLDFACPNRAATHASSRSPLTKERMSHKKQEPRQAKTRGLSFTESHRLNELPGIITRLEAEIARLSEFMSDPELYARDPVKFRKVADGLAYRQAQLAAAEAEWLALEEKAERD